MFCLWWYGIEVKALMSQSMTLPGRQKPLGLMDWLELQVLYIGAACLFRAAFILNRYREHKDILGDGAYATRILNPLF